MVFDDAVLKDKFMNMDLEPCLKVYNLVSVYPKIIKLGQMITLNVIFHVVVSDYRLVKLWDSPQFPARFRNGLQKPLQNTTRDDDKRQQLKDTEVFQNIY